MAKKITDVEFLKVISDPRRIQIMHLCEQEALSVKELAQKLGEEPSRLYYHVKKLVDYEKLEVVDTRKHGNLTEKLFRTRNIGEVSYLDRSLLANEYQTVFEEYQENIKQGFELAIKSMALWKERKGDVDESIPFPAHVVFDSGTNHLTKKEWLEALQRTHDAWQHTEDGDQSVYPEEVKNLLHETGDEKGSYQFLLISYRIEDGLKMGIFSPVAEEEEKKKKK
ncbi:helix-turn-helix domain-containing protein [Marininema halotolerans]|uniref:Helix-turn-helix domain-containing protein n=1 Tax=Marininema halotolerans TaxID=1155944 RepID=A0A1I6TJB6_9BACL|nr:helix-turn-helix domain-containing protein [Marininema halotolerans]SFS89309.1 Helix-turn-helix domain-containing protein [Marininema halotolerans]